MEDLIATLKAQHATVAKRVEALNEALAAGDAGEVRAHLSAFKTSLLAHLALEDLQLYPGLIAQAESEGDQHRALVARTFSTNMQRISEALVKFLERHTTANQPLALEAFSREWGGIAETLQQRIQAEESTLYPLYARGERTAAGSTPDSRSRKTH